MTENAYTLGLYEKAMPDNMTFEQMLLAAKKSGFDRLEISIDESDSRLSRLDWDRATRKELRNLSFELDVPITTMCLSGHRRFPLGSKDEAVRRRAMELMTKAIDFSLDIGIRIIQLAGYDVYYEPSDSGTRARFCENLALSVEYAAKAGVILGFETMETEFMNTVGKAMKYVDAINSPYLGVYPDIGNLKNASVLYNSPLLDDMDAGRGHIVAAHLKETLPGVFRNFRFGEGHTDYIPCIQKLYAMGVRMFTGEFWYLGEADYMKTLEAASVFLRERIDTAIEASGYAK